MPYRRVAWPCQCCASGAPSLRLGSTAVPACNRSSWARGGGIPGRGLEGKHSRSRQASNTVAGNASTKKSYPGSAGGSLGAAVALPVLDGRFRLWVGLASPLAGGCLLSCCWHPTSFGMGASNAYASSWIFFDWAAGTDLFESFVGPVHLNDCAARAPGGLSCHEPHTEQRPKKD